MSLRDVQFDLEYRNMKKDVIKEFYIPALKNAVSYQRAVGFFSSSSLLDISYGLNSLIENGGKIQLICSPRLSSEDMKAIEEGYERRERIIEKSLLREWSEPQNEFQAKRYNMLANYIASGKLDIKIAFIHAMEAEAIGIFHEKLGLISDGEATVAFSGSLNETNAGFYYNYESIDVYCNWMSDESEKRVETKKAAFQRIWNDVEDNIEVIEFPKVVSEKIQTYNQETITSNYEEILIENEKNEFKYLENYPRIPSDFYSREYQLQAVKEWKNRSYQGIFDMATGTGKTYTALLALSKLSGQMGNHLAVIIVCPFQHLVEQWVEDLKYFSIDPIIGYSGSSYKNYKKAFEDAVFDFRLGVRKFFCFICTNATFSTEVIQMQVAKLGKDTLLIVDEAHNMGAEGLKGCLSPRIEYRLALSATLDRHNDEEGTAALYNYFGEKCIEYTLEMAIDQHMLTPYRYYPILISLAEDELERYQKLTAEIGKCVIVSKSGKNSLSKKGQILALKRARIVAGARNKVSKLLEEMQEYKSKNNILVYCGATKIIDDEWMEDEEGERQIDRISKLLGNELNMRVAQFTSREDKEQRALRLRHFRDEDLQCLIAIKCLDEGVNIPNIRTAFILASTTNPKEYIQRRGRVLRLSKGKEYAEIYDFITLPRPLEDIENLPFDSIKGDSSLIKNELQRMQEFKKLSQNPEQSDWIINELVDLYQLYDEIEIV